jgi:hypothetical protein
MRYQFFSELLEQFFTLRRPVPFGLFKLSKKSLHFLVVFFEHLEVLIHLFSFFVVVLRLCRQCLHKNNDWSGGRMKLTTRPIIVCRTYPLIQLQVASGTPTQEKKHRQNRDWDSQGPKQDPSYLSFFIVKHGNPPFLSRFELSWFLHYFSGSITVNGKAPGQSQRAR